MSVPWRYWRSRWCTNQARDSTPTKWQSGSSSVLGNIWQGWVEPSILQAGQVLRLRGGEGESLGSRYWSSRWSSTALHQSLTYQRTLLRASQLPTPGWLCHQSLIHQNSVRNDMYSRCDHAMPTIYIPAVLSTEELIISWHKVIPADQTTGSHTDAQLILKFISSSNLYWKCNLVPEVGALAERFTI